MAVKIPVKKVNRNKLNLLLDIGLASIFVVEMQEHFIGLTNHERLGLLFGAALLLHLALHWRWVLSITRTFFRKLLHGSRFTYVLNLALFIDLAATIVTGVLISRTLGLSFGLGQSLERVHVMAANLSLLLVGMHVAVHWKWIASHVRLTRISLPSRKASPVTVQEVLS